MIKAIAQVGLGITLAALGLLIYFGVILGFVASIVYSLRIVGVAI